MDTFCYLLRVMGIGSGIVLLSVWQFLADCRLEAQCLLGVTAGLNNQRLG
jgi:hypothetical protein